MQEKKKSIFSSHFWKYRHFQFSSDLSEKFMGFDSCGKG